MFSSGDVSLDFVPLVFQFDVVHVVIGATDPMVGDVSLQLVDHSALLGDGVSEGAELLVDSEIEVYGLGYGCGTLRLNSLMVALTRCCLEWVSCW